MATPRPRPPQLVLSSFVFLPTTQLGLGCGTGTACVHLLVLLLTASQVTSNFLSASFASTARAASLTSNRAGKRAGAERRVVSSLLARKRAVRRAMVAATTVRTSSPMTRGLGPCLVVALTVLSDVAALSPCCWGPATLDARSSPQTTLLLTITSSSCSQAPHPPANRRLAS